MKQKDGQYTTASKSQQLVYTKLKKLLVKSLDLSGARWNWPMAGFLTLPSLQRLLNLNYIYDLQLESAGSILEFGVHYGSSITQLINLRSIKEPHNYSRHIYGFDTFEGFLNTDPSKDGVAKKSEFKVEKNYEDHLNKICKLQEKLAPKSHLQKFSIIKGNAPESFKNLLVKRPELVVSMAIFDMDVYQPTKEILELILPRLHKKSILVFDEFNCKAYPGETQAIIEKMDISKFEFMQSPYLPFNTICKFQNEN